MASTSFAHRLAINSAFPRLSVGMPEPINIGFLGPLSGPVESWGKPGLNGCQIWVDWLNNAGGLLIGAKRYPVQLHSFDCGYDPDLAMQGAREMVETHNVKLLMMLGGDTFSPISEYLMKNKVLTSTLLPSDLSPDTPYLIAPSELHPIYNVTGVDWLSREKPDLKTAAICSQTDALGLPSLATYRAGFEAAGIEVVEEIQYDPDAFDAEQIVGPMLESGADILGWCTSYAPMVHALTEYAFEQAFKGQLISCTLDDYPKLVERTSVEFMEGFVFQFPDFDDPKLREKAFFFNRPKEFFDEYNRRFPDSWSAVSWEYVAILDIWHAAVEKAGTSQPVSVLAAMKQLGEVTHAFGPAQWWGDEMFGISNALVGDWPVVTIQNGKAKIVEFGSIPNWLAKNGEFLKAEMNNLGQLWDQRASNPNTSTIPNARTVSS